MEVLYDIVPEIEARRGVRFELGQESGSSSQPRRLSLMHQDVHRAARAADGLGIRHLSMASGAGHDAAAFAQAASAGMLFVRNQHGSHNPKEDMRIYDFAQACAVVQRWAAEAAEGDQGRYRVLGWLPISAAPSPTLHWNRAGSAGPPRC